MSKIIINNINCILDNSFGWCWTASALFERKNAKFGTLDLTSFKAKNQQKMTNINILENKGFKDVNKPIHYKTIIFKKVDNI